MSTAHTAETTAIVTGAGRGFGRGIATALVEAGVRVIGVARCAEGLEELRVELGDGFVPVVADAADPSLPDRLIHAYRPRTLVLNAGVNPVLAPLHEHTWDTFRDAWETDVKQVFHWVRSALRHPLPPGSSVLSLSSGAAVNGSYLTGGYAGAKATIRFISAYAADESARGGLGIRFVSVLPKLTPATDLGAGAVAAYAARRGVDVPTFLADLGATLTEEQVGTAFLELAEKSELDRPAYLLTTDGLRAL
ncbi:SDR family oxidoreductase [Streptomyces sp. R302]|uniref:SDR family oxidoreductase n=1 Tax=unclassified Streptomyces TaxID=2593676 RepID=UPI00145E7AA6|nr:MULTISPECIES: SDR family oxidoreductase [unclassified Streptomyces]NML51001.1 SDR family oxidoreductase [Streptomyces sp. R301]NML81095.1 SDR family oxidoreductase [Streptomyces sp. R302]